MKRLIPVRVTLGVLGILFVLTNAMLPRFGGTPAGSDVVLAVLGMLTVVVAGDTVRPSGMPPASAATAELVRAELQRLIGVAARRRGPAPQPASEEPAPELTGGPTA